MTLVVDHEHAAQGSGVLKMLWSAGGNNTMHIKLVTALDCHCIEHFHMHLCVKLLVLCHSAGTSFVCLSVPCDRGDPGAPKWDSHWGMERLSQLNPGGCSPIEEQRLSGRNRQTRDEQTRTLFKPKTAGKKQTATLRLQGCWGWFETHSP